MIRKINPNSGCYVILQSALPTSSSPLLPMAARPLLAKCSVLLFHRPTPAPGTKFYAKHRLHGALEAGRPARAMLAR